MLLNTYQTIIKWIQICCLLFKLQIYSDGVILFKKIAWVFTILPSLLHKSGV